MTARQQGSAQAHTHRSHTHAVLLRTSSSSGGGGGGGAGCVPVVACIGRGIVCIRAGGHCTTADRPRHQHQHHQQQTPTRQLSGVDEAGLSVHSNTGCGGRVPTAVHKQHARSAVHPQGESWGHMLTWALAPLNRPKRPAQPIHAPRSCGGHSSCRRSTARHPRSQRPARAWACPGVSTLNLLIRTGVTWVNLSQYGLIPRW
eukprot:COSAG01_NODE_22811_length_840_cov_1.205128_1_plen_201_part_10